MLSIAYTYGFSMRERERERERESIWNAKQLKLFVLFILKGFNNWERERESERERERERERINFVVLKMPNNWNIIVRIVFLKRVIN